MEAALGVPMRHVNGDYGYVIGDIGGGWSLTVAVVSPEGGFSETEGRGEMGQLVEWTLIKGNDIETHRCQPRLWGQLTPMHRLGSDHELKRMEETW